MVLLTDQLIIIDSVICPQFEVQRQRWTGIEKLIMKSANRRGRFSYGPVFWMHKTRRCAMEEREVKGHDATLQQNSEDHHSQQV